MKAREFIYTVRYASRPRLVGGTNYEVTVWENSGAGKLILLGSAKRCTASHRGESSEAWCIVVQERPRILQRLPKNGHTDIHYFSPCELDAAKIYLTRLH